MQGLPADSDHARDHEPGARVLLTAFGAEIVLTPGPKGMKAAIAKADEILAQTPNGFMLQQFANPANPKIHLETTGPEIWEDTDGKIDFLVSGVGTGGTITGVTDYIRPRKPSFKAIAVEPDGESGALGRRAQPAQDSRHRRRLYSGNPAHRLHFEVIQISSEDAVAMARRLPKEEGLLMGISSGAAVLAAIRVAQRPENAGKLIVTVLPSFGERYLSSILFDNLRKESMEMTAVAV